MSRIAILCHSTNPRGGVVHALELGAALGRLGHEAAVHAPDAGNRGFFRPDACPTVRVPATSLAPPADTATLIETRVADYLAHFADHAARRFDVFHAQDGISGNALATLKARGLIEGFARTVHHNDDFSDPHVAALQERAILSADAHFVVSSLWRDELAARYGIEATLVGNGVDRTHFSPRAQPADRVVRKQLGFGAGPVFLSVGGVESRKNSVRILQAFAQVAPAFTGAQLVIAGGSSLLDHTPTQARFRTALEASGLPAGAFRQLGPVEDRHMPALFRLADALVFPSVNEGFGLVVLEAMASGLPVVTSRIRPFTGYLGDDDVLWCDPTNVGSIAAAMRLSLDPQMRARCTAHGFAVAARHGWDAVARAHLGRYAALREAVHA